MNEARFTELIDGLGHPPARQIWVTRLVGALRAVVEAAGAAGERALEEYCAAERERGNAR